ncbi:hypothetical protein BKA70DRAFT_1424810 [Coprinopsis sp. MPI-PUGE-AT-0042]|nr:hypothetical protein BKA70DRAFT_1424810 [Coprinopsis sp. MPI-PUGE-AT-0042]
MTLRWVLEETITDDNFCRAQGYLKLIGTNAIDFSTLGITIHTFTVLVLRWTQPRFRHMAKYLTVGVWVVVVLITSISQRDTPQGLDGSHRLLPRKWSGIMAEYLWMWIIGVITAVLYGVGFVVLRPNRGPNANDDDDVREMRRIANELLWYPVVYLVCITPQSFGRWFSFSGYDVPYQFTLFARTLFSLSGVFNAILFFNTRYHLLNGGPSTEAINAAPPSEHDTTNSVTAGGPAMRETVPLTRFPTSDSHILNLERRGESSTARAAQTGVRRVPRVDDEEVDLGLAPP